MQKIFSLVYCFIISLRASLQWFHHWDQLLFIHLLTVIIQPCLSGPCHFVPPSCWVREDSNHLPFSALTVHFLNFQNKQLPVSFQVSPSLRKEAPQNTLHYNLLKPFFLGKGDNRWRPRHHATQCCLPLTAHAHLGSSLILRTWENSMFITYSPYYRILSYSVIFCI